MLWLVLMLSACGGGSSENQSNDVSQASGNLILDTSHGGGGSAWGLAECSTCHAMQVIHQNVDDVRGIVRGMVRDKGYSTCTGCHGRNGTGESEPRRCGVCHNGADLSQAPQLSGQHAHGFKVGEAGSLGDEQCIDCHVASDMNGVFEPNRDLTRYVDEMQILSNYSDTSDFCLRCHNRDHQQTGFEILGNDYDDPLIAVEDAFRFTDQHGQPEGSGTRTYAGLRTDYEYPSVVACTDCHAMHGTDNTKLIIDNSTKGVKQLDPSLRETPYGVNVVDGDYSQLCVLCHQMAVVLDAGDQDAGNGLSGVHEVGSDCRPCHTHGEATQAGL
jgi:nitrate reductase cytochrome c-type subunit